MSMVNQNWKANKIKKKGKGSQTPGSQKGFNCRATATEKYMAKRSRSYKDPRYSQWLAIKNGLSISRKLA